MKKVVKKENPRRHRTGVGDRSSRGFAEPIQSLRRERNRRLDSGCGTSVGIASRAPSPARSSQPAGISALLPAGDEKTNSAAEFPIDATMATVSYLRSMTGLSAKIILDEYGKKVVEMHGEEEEAWDTNTSSGDQNQVKKLELMKKKTPSRAGSPTSAGPWRSPSDFTTRKCSKRPQ